MGVPVRRASDEVVFYGRAGSGRATSILLIGLPLLIALALGTWRLEGGSLDRVRLIGAGAAEMAPEQLLSTAAGELEQATSTDGAGYTFTVLQQSSLNARPGGPLVAVPDPEDPDKTLGTTEQLAFPPLLERGAVSPKGFWLEMRDGPKADQPVDVESLTYQFGAIVLGDTTYRNDGEGWYETQRPPGIGLDPATVALLPAMLRGGTDAKSVALESVGAPTESLTPPTAAPEATASGDPSTVPAASAASDPSVAPADVHAVAAVEVTTKVDDIPGVIAVDAAAFTELTKPVELAFDDQGRLVRLVAVARNTRMDTFDLMVTTTITFDYPVLTPDIPAPEPRFDPNTLDEQAED